MVQKFAQSMWTFSSPFESFNVPFIAFITQLVIWYVAEFNERLCIILE